MGRQLTCCFCSCHLFTTLVSTTTFIEIHISLGRVQSGCDDVHDDIDQQICSSWTGSPVIACLMYLSAMLTILLGASSFWFGNKLYMRLEEDLRIEYVLPVTTPPANEFLSQP